MSDSVHDRLQRARRPKVELRYENPNIQSPISHAELPFTIGVLANLSGHKANRPAFRERRWRSIDCDDYNDRMEKIEPTLTVTAAGMGEFTLRFRELDDFGPAQVAAQVPVLTELIHARRRLGQFAGEQGELDRLLSDLTGRSAILRSLADELRPAQQVQPAAAPPPATGAALLDQILGGMAPVEVGSGGGDTIDQIIRHAAMAGPTVFGTCNPRSRRGWRRWIGGWVTASGPFCTHPDFAARSGAASGTWCETRNRPIVENSNIRRNSKRIVADLASSPARCSTKPRFNRSARAATRSLLLGSYEFGPGDIGLLAQPGPCWSGGPRPFVAAAASGLTGPAGLRPIYRRPPI